jgi:2-aminoethylphosphonate-pyruvate transaminase
MNIPENPYLLLTPGPLSTSTSVKTVMLRDWCTWDRDYNDLVQDIRHRLVKLAGSDEYTAVLMQGSGTFSVEAAIGTMMPKAGKLLVIANGAYGQRIAQITRVLQIPLTLLDFGETDLPDIKQIKTALTDDPTITHVAMVHCETTTGMLNPITEVGQIVKEAGRTFMVDAMSSFGGIDIDWSQIGADIVVSSANKCIQGVPGFGFILVRETLLHTWKGQARSLSMDVYDQWNTMEKNAGKWRYTSPTHVVRAFLQALRELEDEGGIACRQQRYEKNHQTLVAGMRELGYETLIPDAWQSPFITSFRYPQTSDFVFQTFYDKLKRCGFVIYPGKVSNADCFRIGTIGHVFPGDIQKLLEAIAISQS